MFHETQGLRVPLEGFLTQPVQVFSNFPQFEIRTDALSRVANGDPSAPGTSQLLMKLELGWNEYAQVNGTSPLYLWDCTGILAPRHMRLRACCPLYRSKANVESSMREFWYPGRVIALKTVATPEVDVGARPVIAAIGTFDGLHLGHRQLFETALKIKAGTGLPVMVIGFHPHPKSLVKPGGDYEKLADAYGRKASFA